MSHTFKKIEFPVPYIFNFKVVSIDRAKAGSRKREKLKHHQRFTYNSDQ